MEQSGGYAGQRREGFGKVRPFGRGLVLIIPTFGLYALYWHYKAYHELTQEFPRLEHPTLIYILGLFTVIGIPIYLARFIDDLNAARSRLKMAEGVTKLSFFLWLVPGSLLLGIGPLIAYYKLQGSINEVWGAIMAGEDEAADLAPKSSKFS